LEKPGHGADVDRVRWCLRNCRSVSQYVFVVHNTFAEKCRLCYLRQGGYVFTRVISLLARLFIHLFIDTHKAAEKIQ